MYRALDLWLLPYLCGCRFRKPDGTVEIMVAICDHFEPFHAADKREALNRLAHWKREFPKLIEPFRDTDGVRPRHTFFYPIEQYDVDLLEEITEICGLSGGEVEVHLHHDQDTAEGLREKLEKGKADLTRHNLLSRDAMGNICYGFIHGNWALDDSHPQGHHCGVPNELGVLKSTGCYADFTMPSVPDPTQTRIINSIYYARDTPEPKSHDTGFLARVKDKVRVSGSQRPNASSGFNFDDSTPNLLLVQGPLGLNWEHRKFGFLPRIENGEITGSNPPEPHRWRVWERLGIHVQGRPEWIFIKLHTHGALPQNYSILLSGPMRRFHQWLAENRNDKNRYRLHYVTAREMVNILHAAEDGLTGNPGQYRDYRYHKLVP